METLKKMLNQLVWNENHSSVWKEIVSRFGQADYDDLTKRAGHEATLEAEWTAQEYARNRQAEYPDWGSQLDYIYHNGIAKWKSDMVKPVKDAHPKP